MADNELAPKFAPFFGMVSLDPKAMSTIDADNCKGWYCLCCKSSSAARSCVNSMLIHESIDDLRMYVYYLRAGTGTLNSHLQYAQVLEQRTVPLNQA